MGAAQKDSPGLIGRGIGFVGESWEEIKKVSYPTRQETVQATTVVIFIMVVVAAFLATADLLFNMIMRSVLS